MRAEVVAKYGRLHLVVGGLYLATEGDICRDPSFVERIWTPTMLFDACAVINGPQWATARGEWKVADVHEEG